MAGKDLPPEGARGSPTAKVFNCSSCGGGVVIRALGQSIAVTCGSCGTIFDSSNENYTAIAKASLRGSKDQIIPLGQRGKLHGSLWEVIGYLERSEVASPASVWSEYLLFNPQKGFRWLTEFQGHWNYVLTIKAQPELNSSSKDEKNEPKTARYLNKSYYLFNRGRAITRHVVGEFYWQVRIGESVWMADYISPPEILSSERNEGEIIWSLGEYLESETVRTAFNISKPMPLQTAVAPNQLATVATAASYAGKYWAVFIGILIIIQVVSMIWSKEEIIYGGQLLYRLEDTEKLKVTSQFEVKSGPSNLEVSIAAPVQNSWFELQSDLVNDNNGETQEFEQGVEYYSGRDSDGPWVEGSRYHSIVLSSVPEGKYHLNIEGSGPALPVIAPSSLEEITTPKDAVDKIETWPDGKTKSIEPQVNGKTHGIAKYFFNDGKINAEISYKNGKKYGKYRTYHQDGSLEQTGTYLNGKLHGFVQWYSAAGANTRSVFYNEGILIPEGPVDTSKALPVDLMIKQDVVTWSNFFWAVLLVSLFPAWILWRNRSFELDRWSQSDYSPYLEHHEGTE